MCGPGGYEVDATKSFIVRAFVSFKLHTSPEANATSGQGTRMVTEATGRVELLGPVPFTLP